jgi:DNA polymerase III delta prime subunit
MLTDQAGTPSSRPWRSLRDTNIFILATRNPEDPLYTIMSRCSVSISGASRKRRIVEQLKAAVCRKDGITFDEGAFHHVAVEGTVPCATPNPSLNR